jgi:TonB family protein
MTHLGPALRRAKVRESPRARLLVALAASLVVNAIGVWVLHASGALTPPAAKPVARVALAEVDGAAWEANRRVTQPTRPRSQPPDAEPKGTVIELPPEDEAPAASEPPRDARHLAERDRKVEKETFSRFAGEYPEVAASPQLAAPGRRGGARGDPATTAGEAGRAGEARKGAEEKGADGTKGERLALAPAPLGESLRGELGDGGGRARGRLAPDLALGPEGAAKVLAGPSFDGYGEGLEEGYATHLDAVAFKYATFFNRLRNEIGEEWIPRVREAVRDRDPDGRMFVYRDRTVVVGITLESDGRISDVAVIDSSNVDFLDRVAVAAVRAAQPFPNPPRGLFADAPHAQFAFYFTFLAADDRPRIRWAVPRAE